MSLLRVLGIAVLATGALLTSPAFAQMTPQERKGLSDALYLANLNEKDLQYEKKFCDDPFRLPLNKLALDDPLAAANRLMKLHAAGGSSLSQLLAMGSREVFQDPISAPGGVPVLGPIPESVPEEMRESLEILLGAIDEATSAVHKAAEKLNPDEQRELLETLPIWSAATPAVTFSFTKRTGASRERVMSLLSRVDLPAMRAAGVRLSKIVEDQVPTWKGLSRTAHLQGVLNLRIHGYKVEISAEEGLTHTSRDTNLCISLGNRNHFVGRFGAGLGYGSVLLDFGDSNSYDVPDLSVGAGVLGVGLAYVSGGNDVFRGGSCCFGAGLAGCGAMYHQGGEATYRATSLSQGFGAFGIGLLQDTGDLNQYSGRLLCQGAARPQGFGWLVQEGSCSVLNASALQSVGKPNRLCESQGYACGYGTDDDLVSGGVALLTSLGERTTYIANGRAQAVGLNGGVGSLYDGAPGGSHTADQECQGYARRQGGAFLFSLGGHTSFVAQGGDCHGSSNERSVSVLLDRGGYTAYAAKDSRPATAFGGALSIFLSSGDQNRFYNRPSLGLSGSGSSSLSLFCDLGSNTAYAEPVSLASSTVDDNISVFLSEPGLTGIGADVSEPAVSVPTFMKIPRQADLAELWNRARRSGPVALDARKKLISIGAPAAEVVLNSELAVWKAEDSDAIAEVIGGIGDDARRILAVNIDSNDPTKQANALRIACVVPGPILGSAIAKALTKPSVARIAARASGLCKAKECVTPLLVASGSTDPILAAESLGALNAIEDPASAGTAAALVRSSQWPVRRLAVALVSKWPNQAFATAADLLKSPVEQERRTGVQILAALGNSESIRRLGVLLQSGDSGMIVEALIGLRSRIPDQLRTAVLSLQSSPDLTVRRMADGIQVDH